MPLFDGEATIGEALSSLIAQSMPAWQAIVIDDGSRDGGALIAREYASRDARMTLIRQPNRGLAAARNTGIEHAQGEYLHFLDCDDRLLPGALERLLAAAEKTGAAYGGSLWIDESGRSMGWSFSPSCPMVGLEQLIEFNRWTPGGQIVRRDLVGMSRFDSAPTGAEDHDFWLRLAADGVRWSAVDGDVVAYRQRPASMSRDHARMARGRCIALERAMRNIGMEPASRIRILTEAALAEATANAWSDRSPGLSASLGILREHLRGSCINAMQAASAAAWSLPHGACLSPASWEDDLSAIGLCSAASRWWRALEQSEFAAEGLAESSWGLLARRIVPPERIARRMVEQVPAGRPIILLGMGRHAAYLARGLAAMGREFAGFDDTARAGEQITLGGVEVRIAGPVEAFDAANVQLLTPWSDESLLARVPRGACCLRWSAVAAELARFESARLRRLTLGRLDHAASVTVQDAPREAA